MEKYLIYITTCEVIECSNGRISERKYADDSLVSNEKASDETTLERLRFFLRESIKSKTKRSTRLGYRRTEFSITSRLGEDPSKAIEKDVILSSRMKFENGDDYIIITLETKKAWVEV